MSLESDLALFVSSIPAFTNPIATFLGTTLPDPAILQKTNYWQAPQNVEAIQGCPYLYWKGPYNDDLGQAAKGVSGTRKEDFWFIANAATTTAAMAWCNSIKEAVQAYFDAHSYINLTNWRICAAIYRGTFPLEVPDQVQRTSQQFPVSQARIGYTFGYQHSLG